ncbi:uncharacterized protein LOC130995399 [Salvia miltiorrhiza]|uniref:uncharacterized protein LOC130995399 n=1 Tax=Salvia miltiorrhiza TaxID=226208 RepID=UPI0025ABCA58|nr:uncharacterized protein LOC130995399 [Salvia miltiorrhiza]
MSRKSSVRSRRAWDVIRLALLWARRGGVFKNRLAINMSLLQKGIRKLRHSHHHAPPLVYGERELSFDDTPVIHVKMHRPSSLRFKMPHIPCIKPHVDFDYDFEFDDDRDEIYGYGAEEEDDEDEEVNIGDEEVDLKAEEFIANFYKQMKLQRQISYLQYNEKGST